jgi:hypothetical protein
MDQYWNQRIEGTILVADLFAIVTACQLLGLQDAVDNPDFFKNGGWLQPITWPSTISTLITRISESALVWILAAIAGRAYNERAMESSTVAVTTAVKTAVLFGITRLLLAALVSTSTIHMRGWDGTEILRECYFVAVATIGARYSVYLLFYKR